MGKKGHTERRDPAEKEVVYTSPVRIEEKHTEKTERDALMLGVITDAIAACNTFYLRFHEGDRARVGELSSIYLDHHKPMIDRVVREYVNLRNTERIYDRPEEYNYNLKISFVLPLPLKRLMERMEARPRTLAGYRKTFSKFFYHGFVMPYLYEQVLKIRPPTVSSFPIRLTVFMKISEIAEWDPETPPTEQFDIRHEAEIPLRHGTTFVN